MTELKDTTLLWVVFVCVTVGFVAGSFWRAHVQPPVLVEPVPVAPSVTVATSAPPVPASIEAGTG